MLEIATFINTSYTFVPFSYTYISIPPRFKSAVTRDKPVFNISNKLYRSNKLSGLIFNGPRLLIIAAANNNKGYKSRIQGIF